MITYMNIYIYIHIEREREKERERLYNEAHSHDGARAAPEAYRNRIYDRIGYDRIG